MGLNFHSAFALELTLQPDTATCVAFTAFVCCRSSGYNQGLAEIKHTHTHTHRQEKKMKQLREKNKAHLLIKSVTQVF